MNRSILRGLSARGSRCRALAGLETGETARRPLRSRRLRRRMARLAFVSAITCALFGWTAFPASADEAKPAAPTPTTAPAAPVPAKQDAPAEEAAPAGPEPGEVTISGLVDWYFGWNFRKPRAAGGGSPGAIVTPSGESIALDNLGTFFAVNDREPSFSLGEVNITRAPGKGFPLGVTATLTFGNSARLFHATEPGGTSSWQTLHNLYLTYPGKVGNKDVAVDFGKWASPFGLEVLESHLNDNYTRAYNFWYGVPFYHFGIRATSALSDRLTAQVGLVNGWNNVADDNAGKTGYFQLNFKPTSTLGINLSYIGGEEGTGAGFTTMTAGAGKVTTHLLDLNGSWQVTDALKLAGWASYGSAAGSVNAVPVSGNWLGLVGYARYQVTPALAVAVRGEQFEDYPGVGGVGQRFFAPGGYLKLNEVTFTVEYKWLRDRLISRLEYRHDWSNQAVFFSGTGGAARDQDTVFFSQVVKF